LSFGAKLLAAAASSRRDKLLLNYLLCCLISSHFRRRHCLGRVGEIGRSERKQICSSFLHLWLR